VQIPRLVEHVTTVAQTHVSDAMVYLVCKAVTLYYTVHAPAMMQLVTVVSQRVLAVLGVELTRYDDNPDLVEEFMVLVRWRQTCVLAAVCGPGGAHSCLLRHVVCLQMKSVSSRLCDAFAASELPAAAIQFALVAMRLEHSRASRSTFTFLTVCWRRVQPRCAVCLCLATEPASAAVCAAQSIVNACHYDSPPERLVAVVQHFGPEMASRSACSPAPLSASLLSRR
jgi:hypothetical protein